MAEDGISTIYKKGWTHSHNVYKRRDNDLIMYEGLLDVMMVLHPIFWKSLRECCSHSDIINFIFSFFPEY